MKILFVTAHFYLPQMYGGVQKSTDQLCRHLMERGHDVAVLATLEPSGLFGWNARLKMQINKRIAGCEVAQDFQPGYPVWRTWYPWETIDYVAGQEKPDLVVVLAIQPVRMALAAKARNIPVLMHLQDVAFSVHGGPFEALGDVPCIACSQFTADKYHSVYGVNPTVIYPLIPIEEYRIKTTRDNITFINPIAEKGCDISLEIARLCPDIPFSFVEAWPLSESERHALKKKLSSLPNVSLSPPQKNMRAVYGKCKILLAPSRCEEAYGRVVSEAQINGTPAIASKRGGLPEAVGPGGILIDPNAPIEEWVKAIRTLWQDDKTYAELSATARTHAQRPEMNLAMQLDAYEEAFLAASGRIN